MQRDLVRLMNSIKFDTRKSYIHDVGYIVAAAA